MPLLKHIWETIPVDEEITIAMLQKKANSKSTQSVRNFLDKQVKEGKAVRDGKWGSKVYKKTEPTTPQASYVPKRDEDTLTDITTGRAVLAVIDDMAETIKNQKQELKILIEQNKELNLLYKQAQEKILALNVEANNRKSGRSVKLSELQDIAKGKTD